MTHNMLKVFLWRRVFKDYAYGMAFAIASSRERAIELLVREHSKDPIWQATTEMDEADGQKHPEWGSARWLSCDLEKSDCEVVSISEFAAYMLGGG